MASDEMCRITYPHSLYLPHKHQFNQMMSTISSSTGGGGRGEVTSSVSSRAIDLLSPYYIHASDSSGHVYVTYLLHDSNYAE